MIAIEDIADQHWTHEERVASFQKVTRRASAPRTSNASLKSSKTTKSLKWPHKNLTPEELATAGFFYHPSADNVDNTVCFLCLRSLDGWNEDDDPLVEHFKFSPDCGWAISSMIERQDEELSKEYPLNNKMIEARKATFAEKWPHEGKKGWKCKVKKMVDGGWRFTPTPESDDMATCPHCGLALDGWEKSDSPADEHYKRSPECAFFELINIYKSAPKPTKNKRVSKASRLSTQSSDAVASDMPAEEDDSILTTATNATNTTNKKGRPKKKAIRTKKEAHIWMPEVTSVEIPVKASKKRKSEEEVTGPAKRRATQTRSINAANSFMSSTNFRVTHSVQDSSPAQENKSNMNNSPALSRQSPKVDDNPEPLDHPSTPSKYTQSSEVPRSSRASKNQALEFCQPLRQSSKPKLIHSDVDTDMSDAENIPPSLRRSLPQVVMTPIMSPSKRNMISGLQSIHPWTSIDLETVFTKSPGDENRSFTLSSPEKKMTVEKWIRHEAGKSEAVLREDCERMVTAFENYGARALKALESIQCN